jgi:flagellar basal body-associated protein FliL
MSKNSPRKGSENFHTQHEHAEAPEPIDHAKEIADLAWSIDVNKQTPDKEKMMQLKVLIEVKNGKCKTEKKLKDEKFKAIETSVFHPDDLLITDMKTGEVKLDESMLGHFANRYIANFTNEGLKRGKDWDIAKRDDGTYVIYSKS